MVDVLLPMMASAGQAASMRARVPDLISGTSGTASSTNWASATASSIDAAAVTPAATRSRASGGNSPRAAWSAASAMMRSRPAAATSGLTSASDTLRPARASTWAMPPPM